MNTRRTADYSPIRKGSKAEQQAINARREMLQLLVVREYRAPDYRLRKKLFQG